MEEQQKKATGRPKKDPARHKRNRTISLTDAEHAELASQAAAVNLGVSEYVIEKLNLNKRSLV